MKNLGYVIGIVLMLSICSGCEYTRTNMTQTPTLSRFENATPILSPATITPAVNQIIPTNTITPTITSTKLPTKDPNMYFDFTHEMAVTNGGCELPCIWGYSVGRTDWEEYENNLASLGIAVKSSQVDEISTMEDVYFLTNPESQRDTIYFQFYQVQSETRAIHAGFELYDDLSILADRYSMKHIFDVLGPPDEVFLDYFLDGQFQMILYYDQAAAWMIVRYDVELESQGSHYQFCINGLGSTTANSERLVSIIIQNPEDPLSLEGINNIYWMRGVDYPNPLYPNTGISVEDFYSRIVNEDHPCFETPIDQFFSGAYQ